MSNSSAEANSYDQSPYESLPFFYSRPEYLSAIGQLFGMTPPALPTARVLELGAAAGGSLITFAARYPQSKSLGIDLSKEQIAHGQAQVQALQLQNLELKAMSLMDLNASHGQFDYIICHGVFSWVSDLERAKILEIAADHLSPNGIVFISYNTLPGWNQMATLRDMLRFHTGRFEGLREKVDQARLFLGFVASAVADRNDSHSSFLRQEAADLLDKPESYLLHEYLIGENQPFYFVDFMRAAAAKGLAYLGDSHVAAMDDLPEPFGAALAEIGDIVQVEQYMDFINNRRFRGSLLCRAHVPLNRKVQPGVMGQLFFSMDVESADIDYRDDGEAVEFLVSGGKASAVTAATSVLKAVMLSFMKFRGSEVTVEDILQNVLVMLPELEPVALREELNEVFVALVLKEVARPVAARSLAIASISERPKVSALVRLQVLNPAANWVSNEVNEPIAISEFGRLALRYMNGERTREDIVGLLVSNHAAELEVEVNGAPVLDEALLAQAIAGLLDSLLEEIRFRYLLIG